MAEKTFRMITDDLFLCVSHEEAAKAMGCSIALVRQARRDKDSPAFRNPPPGWEKAVLRLAEKQARHFQKLIEKIRASE
jgi:hypothetical protein